MRSAWADPRRRIFLVIIGALGIYIYLTVHLGGITPRDMLYTFYGIFYFAPEYIRPNVIALLLDVLFFGLGGLVFWVAFFAQFVLPVQTVPERVKVVRRLLSTLGTGQGPAIFIRNGEIVKYPEEEKRRGAGVIILDSASAAVLRRKSAYTEAVGPGLIFTGPGEGIAGTLDLRTQVRRIGPAGDGEDPFVEEVPGESEEQREGRKARRLQTSGLTRDGVEVIPNISVVFRINAQEGEGGSRFGFNPDAVTRAVAYQPINPAAPSDSEAHRRGWEWLPVSMAADLWREYLRKFTFDELFEPPDRKTWPEEWRHKTGLEVIVDMIKKRLKDDWVLKTNEVCELEIKRETEKGIEYIWIRSPEEDKVRNRGLRVVNVSVSNLRFPKTPIEDKLIQRWRTTWLDRAKEEQKYIEQRRSLEKARGQQDALKLFSALVSRPLYQRVRRSNGTRIPRPDLALSMELLLLGTRDAIYSAELQHQLADMESELDDMIEWLRKGRNGTSTGQP